MNRQQVSILMRLPMQQSMGYETWMARGRQDAVGAHLEVAAAETMTLAQGVPVMHLTLVSGSAGTFHRVLLRLDDQPFEIGVEGGFVLAREVHRLGRC